MTDDRIIDQGMDAGDLEPPPLDDGDAPLEEPEPDEDDD